MDYNALADNVLAASDKVDDLLGQLEVTVEEGQLALLVILGQSSATLAYDARRRGKKVSDFEVLSPYVKSLHSIYAYYMQKLNREEVSN